MAKTLDFQNRDFNGLCFINLVDFDMTFGHRRDVDGYANALCEFDEWLSVFIDGMREDDCFIITADHGCDPAFHGTDHTREYVPFLMYGKNIEPKNLGTINGFYFIADTAKELLGAK